MICSLWGSSEHVQESDEAGLARLLERLGLEVEQLEHGSPPPGKAGIVVVNSKTRVGRFELEAMPELRLLVTTTSGHDHVDLPGAAARGVLVARCPLARRDAVVETAVAMGISLLRRLPALLREAEQGRWVRASLKTVPVPLLRDVVVGVVGKGVIGARAVQVFETLGAKVIAADPADRALPPITELFEQADLLTLHCSLTATSRRLITADTLRLLKPGAVLVNTARGECVDLRALLEDRRLGGYGIDVFGTEPPAELAQLAGRENILITPHSAGYHQHLGKEIAREVEQAICAFLEGRSPEHLVSPPSA
ncbi:MAG: NAD(P)-dependent oxidoreductase [Planctomycetota bacterium]